MRCNKCGIENLGTSNYCAHCGHALLEGLANVSAKPLQNSEWLNDPLNYKPGELFAKRYRIVGEIGRGGMGRVYRALDIELNKEIAIKVIRPEYLDDEQMVKRFKNEILLAREISHENVVRIHDFSEWNGIKYITMQFVDGMTLREQLTLHGSVPVELVESLAIQICSGLESARKREIAHRDLKPQNILLDQKNHAYIADFGLAKSLSHNSGSFSGVIVGTPEYIAPEQWRGERGDYRSDIYSLGVILYEMVTARPLFTSETELGYLQKHLNETPVFSPEEKQKIPDYLKRIILRCLAKDPMSRYQRAADVAEDLAAHRATARPFNQRVLQVMRRGGWLALVLIAVALLVWDAFLKKKAQDSIENAVNRRVAIMPFVNHTGEERFAFWSSALSDLLSIDLGQSRILQVVPANELQRFIAEHVDWNNLQLLTPQQLISLHDHTGAEFVLLGELNRAGERFRLGMRLMVVKGGAVEGSFHSDGLGEASLIEMVDGLTEKIKLAFRLPPEVIIQDENRDLRQISTRSVEALKHFTQAKAYQMAKKPQDALTEYERAIADDPDFALPYAEAALLMNELGDSRGDLFHQLSVARQDRMSKRDALFFQGAWHRALGNNKMALGKYQALLAEYPADTEGLLALGQISRSMERWQSSGDAFKRLLKLMPGRSELLGPIFYNEMIQGHYVAALQFSDLYQEALSDLGVYHKGRTQLFLEQGRLDLARSEMETMRLSDKPFDGQEIYWGDILLLEDNLGGAEGQYRLLLDEKQTAKNRLTALQRLSNLAMHRGQVRQALAFLEQMKEEGGVNRDAFFKRHYDCLRLQIFLYADDRDLMTEANEWFQDLHLQLEKGEIKGFDRLLYGYYLSRIKIKAGDFNALDGLLKNMDEEVALCGEAFARYPLHLRSERLLAKGDLQGAKNEILKAQKLFPNPQLPHGMGGSFLHTLATIESRLGNPEEAEAIYRSIIDKNVSRIDSAAGFVLAHFELAQLYRKHGSLTESLDTLAKVKRWWSGQDKGHAQDGLSLDLALYLPTP